MTRGMHRRLGPAGVILALVAGSLCHASPPSPEEIIRKVARSQRAAEEKLASYTYDQVEVQTDFDSAGRPRKTKRRLFYSYQSEGGKEGTRELVEVDGRPATEEEKREAAEGDEKRRRSRGPDRAAGEASRPQKVEGDEDDVLVGPRRLSDLLSRYTFHLAGEDLIDSRPSYVIEFRPRPGLLADKLSDRALNSLSGVLWVDASDLQIRKVEARLVHPLKVGGGLLANVKSAAIAYEAAPARSGFWFPCLVEFRLAGKTGLFFKLDRSFRFEFSNFRSFEVETSSEVGTSGAATP